MNFSKAFPLTVLLLLLTLCACMNFKQAVSREKVDAEGGSSKKVSTFDFALSPGEGGSLQSDAPKAVAVCKPLEVAAGQKLLNRLPTLPDESSAQEFYRRTDSVLPPRSGKNIEVPFPATEDMELAGHQTINADTPLTVLERFTPQGLVQAVPGVSLTFSQPMIAIQEVEGTKKNIPAQIKPEVAGSWRWLGTKTAVFEPSGPYMPMSSEYEVTVPGSLKDAAGRPLNKDYKFSFQTERLKFVDTYPRGIGISPNPICYVVFNQKIDREKMRQQLVLAEKGRLSARTEINFLALKQLPQDSKVSRVLQNVPEDHWVAFKPAYPLKAASDYSVILPKGSSSAEGPLTTEAEQSFSFHTFNPLEISGTNCESSWRNGELGVGEKWIIYFNNQLDSARLDGADLIKSITPKLDSMHVAVVGSQLVISGDAKAETKYTVKLNPEICDIYSQKLGSRAKSLTFKVGSLQPYINMPGGRLVFNLLDPDSPNTYSIYSGAVTSFKAKLFKVDFRSFSPEISLYFNNLDEYKGAGRLVWEKTFKIKANKNEYVQTQIDVSEAFADGPCLAILAIESGTRKERDHFAKAVWLQSSSLAADIVADKSNTYIYVTDLKSGQAVKGASVEIGGATVETDENGQAVFPEALDPDDSKHILVRYKKEALMFSSSSTRGRSNNSSLLWSVFSDRGLYRPGETVSVKGWIRSIVRGPEANAFLDGKLKQLSWTLTDPVGAELAKGSSTLSDCGGFDFTVGLPDNINLGEASLCLKAADCPSNFALREFYYNFDVQEFRRPEFEVSTQIEGTDHFMDDCARVSAKVNYFSGGVVSSSPVVWRAEARRAAYAPPGWSKFVFGQWRPWWERFLEGSEVEAKHSLNLVTDSLGQSALVINLGKAQPICPVSMKVSAAVSDVNRQTWSDSTSFLVHPAKLYVGIKPDKFHYEHLVKPCMEFVAVSLDGKIAAGRKISLQSARIDTVYDSSGKAVERELKVINDELISGDKPVQKVLPFSESGLWRVRAQISDDQGRVNETTVRIWVGSFQMSGLAKEKVEKQELTLIPDRQEYLPGQVAEIAVQAPFAAKHGVYTISRSGIAKSQSFAIDGTNAMLKIPISENWLPGFKLTASVSGSDNRIDSSGLKIKDTQRPAYAANSLNIKVSTKEKELQVKVAPKEAGLEPGGSTEVNVSVSDCNGKPVADTEIALVVVDDSVWALSGYSIDNPLRNFYNNQPDPTFFDYVRSLVILNNQKPKIVQTASSGSRQNDYGQGLFMMNSIDGAAMMGRRMAPMAKSMDMAVESAVVHESAANDDGDESAIAIRSNFDPLAIFAATLKTNAEGKVVQKVVLPDNLTRYRIVAVAADKKSRFGLGESSLTARLPLMVRPSAPRFLNFGDKFSLPVVLHNQTSQPMNVQVAARAANLKVASLGAYSCRVPANDRCEVLIPMETEQAGQAVVQVAAASGKYVDSAQCTLPVYTPCTTEGFASYGTVDGDQVFVQPLQRPQDSFKQFGGLDISTSSTALQELTDAVIYLCDYPFECSEQLASRIIVIANLKDVLHSFKAEGLPSQAQLDDFMAASLKKLKQRQNSRGGFGLWIADKCVLPFVSVHCTQALVTARANGFKVDDDMYNRALKYVTRAYEATSDPNKYSRQARLNVAAYADNVLWQAGVDVTNHYTELKKENLSKVYLDTLGWYLPVIKDKIGDVELVEEIRRQINNKVTETAEKANIGEFTQQGDYLILNSRFRDESVLLSAMIFDNPKNSVIPKLVRSLLDGRRRGNWGTTQANAMVVMALNKYFRTYESVTPDFVANLWLGKNYVGQHQFQGRSCDYKVSHVPMEFIDNQSKLTLEKKGAGRLYYRLGLKYALKNLSPEPIEAGFAVARTYEGVDNSDDVRRIDRDTWEFKLGSRVRCRTRLVAPARRAHVALSVPLPAGCEILNSALKMTEELPEDKAQVQPLPYWSYFWFNPFDHQNLRDDKAEVFSLILPGGEYNYSFICRASSPGTFVVPPAKAEEMYSPEVFGRTGGIKVIIK
ncbi:MAG: alpha-2-macroglobulin family protein [Candidatus Bruticola sp.]